MKFTNRLDLPQPLVDLIINDDYTKGEADYSITELFSPPRMRALERQYDDEIVVDVSDRLFALYGKLVHKLLEVAERTELSEQRYFINLGGRRISGQVDRFILSRGVLQDYKFVAVYKFSNGVPIEYEEQINGYAYLLRANGFAVNYAEVVGMLRDWHKGTALRKAPGTYPQGNVIKPQVKLHSDGYTEALLLDRIASHIAADRELPLCTAKDMWQDPDKWAVLPVGKKRAVRVCDSLEQAEEHLKLHPGGYDIEHRVFEPKRCNLYCSVCKWCDQFNARRAVVAAA